MATEPLLAEETATVSGWALQAVTGELLMWTLASTAENAGKNAAREPFDAPVLLRQVEITVRVLREDG